MQFSTKGWRKKLALAITTGLLAGLYVPGAYAADYTKGISADHTGTADATWLGSDKVTVKTGTDGTILRIC